MPTSKLLLEVQGQEFEQFAYLTSISMLTMISKNLAIKSYRLDSHLICKLWKMYICLGCLE